MIYLEPRHGSSVVRPSGGFLTKPLSAAPRWLPRAVQCFAGWHAQAEGRRSTVQCFVAWRRCKDPVGTEARGYMTVNHGPYWGIELGQLYFWLMPNTGFINPPPSRSTRSTRFEIGGIRDQIPLIKVMMMDDG